MSLSVEQKETKVEERNTKPRVYRSAPDGSDKHHLPNEFAFSKKEEIWKFRLWNLKKVNGFKYTQVYSKHGNFGKKKAIILSLYMSLNTILSTDIYVALDQELFLPSISD